MALEFECSYCKATIRVPDAAAGKRGRCPKCAAKINVPKLGQSRRAGDEPVFFPGPPEPEAVALAAGPADDDVLFQEYDPQREATIASPVETELPPGDIVIPDLSAGVTRSLPQPARHLPDSLLSRSKPRRSSGGAWIVIALVVLLGASAAAGWYWWQGPTTMTGELTAELVENPQLAPRSVPRNLIELPPDDTEKILSDLESSPRPMVSSLGLSNVMIAANRKGLSISVAPGSATSLYRVDLSGHAKLATYRSQHAAEFEQSRQENLAIAVNQYCRTIMEATRNKESRIEVGQFRDTVCYAACVQGFGSAIQAVHQRQPHLCVYEDQDAVYFLLPAGVKQFQLVGRPRRKGEKFFEGNFEVKVTGTTRLKSTEPDEPPPGGKSSKETSDDGEMTDDDSE